MKEYDILSKPRYPKWVGELRSDVYSLAVALKYISIASLPLAFLMKKTSYATILYVIGGIAALLYALCFFIQRRLEAINEQYSILENFPPDVLYLRSFRHDKLLAKKPSVKVKNSVPRILASNVDEIESDFVILEDKFAKELEIIGKAIAIGQPGEVLPKLGIPRFHFNNENWEEKVKLLMQLVKLVVIRVDLTDGVLREIAMAAECVQPENLIFLLPAELKSEEYIEFCANIKRNLPEAELPEIYFPEKEPLGNRLLLYFDNQWKAKHSYKDIDQIYVEKRI